MHKKTILCVVAAVLVTIPIAHAQAPDAVIEEARSNGTVGEQSDGYLGIVKAGSADIKARVSQVNIKRKAFYTDLAAKRAVTINEVSGATACEQLKNRVPVGGFYRDETGVWKQRAGNEAAKLPSFCPQ